MRTLAALGMILALVSPALAAVEKTTVLQIDVPQTQGRGLDAFYIPVFGLKCP